MSIYAIGDLHLSFGNPEKTMEVFRGWQDYQRRLEENWRAFIRPEDTVVLAGDISWAMRLATPDRTSAFWTACRDGSSCSRATTTIGGTPPPR